MPFAQQPIQSAKANAFSDLSLLGRLLGSAFRAARDGITAGWGAAVDYRHLSEMSDRELKRRGLSRDDIPQSLYQRHFASLGGWLDNVD